MQPKFRAYDKLLEQMVYPEMSDNWPSTGLATNSPMTLFLTFDGSLYGYFDHRSVYMNSRFILMLSTGIKDINNREIYENDIVKILSRWNRNCISEVIWSKKRVGFVLNAFINIPMGSRKFEIIGNILENPELKEK